MTQNLLLHVDADSFFASVVLRHRPRLAAVPVAVVAHVFVASANYPARARGVRGGMLAQEAQHLCPELVLIDVPRDEVEEVSDALFDIFRESARAVEPGSMEEAFLDVGAQTLPEAVAAGEALRARVARELGIAVSVGIGRTKLMAKLASRAAKPDGIHAIGGDEEAGLRETLPVADVWGLGAKTVERLRLIGVARLGDLDRVPRDELQRVCGTAMARRLRAIREATDDAVLHPVEGRTTLSSEGTISGYNRRDWTPTELLEACVARACRRAERAGLTATGITVVLRAETGAPPVTLKHKTADAVADPQFWTEALRAPLADAAVQHLVGVRATLTGLVSPERAPQTLF